VSNYYWQELPPSTLRVVARLVYSVEHGWLIGIREEVRVKKESKLEPEVGGLWRVRPGQWEASVDDVLP
jgi:hypothetical protein